MRKIIYISFLSNLFSFHQYNFRKKVYISYFKSGSKIFSTLSSGITLEEVPRDVNDRPVKVIRDHDLKNRYFGLRHGESEANIQGIISSDPLVGSTKHGLTRSGVVQSRRAATSILEKIGRENIQNTIIVSSNFTRARQTAEECVKTLKNILALEHEGIQGVNFDIPTMNVVIRNELRERYFGSFDGTILLNYNKVWPRDSVSNMKTSKVTIRFK